MIKDGFAITNTTSVFTLKHLEYSQIIRNLMYLMNYTRLNKAYAISKLCMYNNNPSDNH